MFSIGQKFIAVAIMITAVGNTFRPARLGRLDPETRFGPLVVQLVPVGRDCNRDKTGTTQGRIKTKEPQVLVTPTVLKADAFLTERGGFEPPLPLRADRFSKPARSTTPPPLLVGTSTVSDPASGVKTPVFSGETV